MSDGELFKKIIKKRRVAYLANKSVKEVLDEAKAEFPVEFWFEYYKGDGTPGEMRKGLGNLKKHRANAHIDVNAVSDWFEKWFGAEK